MKLGKIYLLFIITIQCAFLCNCDKKQNNIENISNPEYFYDTGIPWDCVRDHMLSGILFIDTRLGGINFETGKYPIVLDDKIKNEIKRLIPDIEIDDIKSKYTSDGNSYTFLIISTYIICTGDKYTVFKLTDKAIFWKDNYAEPWQTVDDIDWNKVDFVVSKEIIDQNGNITRTPAEAPQIAYPKGAKENAQTDVRSWDKK